MKDYRLSDREGGLKADRLPSIAASIAAAFQVRRLELNITQEELARQSGVSFGSVKRFESKHEISLKHLIQLAMVLKMTDVLSEVFAAQKGDDDGAVNEPEPLYRRRTGKKRTLRIEVPDDVELDDHELEMIIASKLYENGKLSAGDAAVVAGLSKRTFIELLGKHGVSVFSTSIDDLRNDIDNA